MLETKPYEISLWVEEDRYVILQNDVRTVVDSLDNVTSSNLKNEYTEEVRLAVIGNSEHQTPITAFQPKLTKNVNGSMDFSFSIFYKYYDEESKTWKNNPYCKYLNADRHIKLKYDVIRDENGLPLLKEGKEQPVWYDFLIKDITEDQDKYIYTYGCVNMLTNELSKNGYNVELDTELENNMGSVVSLGERILQATDWQVVGYDPIELNDGRVLKSDILKAKSSEILYKYQVENSRLQATVLDDYTYGDNSWTKGDPLVDKNGVEGVPIGSLIYIAQTSYLNQTATIQFFWSDDLYYHDDGTPYTYKTEDDGTILNSPSYITAVPFDYSVTNLSISESFRGNVLSDKIGTVYVGSIDEVCDQYQRIEEYRPIAASETVPLFGKLYYTKRAGQSIYDLFTGDEFADGTTYYELAWPHNDDSRDTTIVDYYAVPYFDYPSTSTLAQLISNNRNFTSNDGWNPAVTTVTDFMEGVTGGYKIHPALSLNLDSSGTCYNTGVDTLKAEVDGLKKGERFIVAIKKYSNAGTINNIIIQGNPLEAEVGATTQHFTTFSGWVGTKPSCLNDWNIYILTVNNSMAQSKLTKYQLTLAFYGSGTVVLEKALMFKERYTDPSDPLSLIVPDLSVTINHAVQERYKFFNVNKVTNETHSLDDISIDCDILTEEIPSNGFTPKVNQLFEKITSITGKESNYYNLIQTLCETFQCWARFDTEYDEFGKLITKYHLTNDTTPQPGIRYYKKIGSATDNEHKNYEWINQDTFFKVNTTSTYHPEYQYYLKATSGIYNEANLGYQFTGFQTQYYTRSYYQGNYIYTRCSSTDSFIPGQTYYMLKREEFVEVTVSDDFHTQYGNYYLIDSNNWTPTSIYERDYSKYVSFVEYTGRLNYVGFKYGINLEGITRRIRSNDIVTKLYIPDCVAEWMENGMCSIVDATNNYTGENTIYNFQYYINNGLISSVALYRDLYTDPKGGMAFFTKLHEWNASVRSTINTYVQVGAILDGLNSKYTTYVNYIESAKRQIDECIEDIIMDKPTLSYDEAYRLPYNSSQDNFLKKAIKKRDRAIQLVDEYYYLVENYQYQLQYYQKYYNQLVARLANNQARKIGLTTQFFKKYSKFIQEGTWTAEDYFDPEKFYSDACSIAYESAFPKIQYNLSAIELSQLKGYEAFDFNVGDKTYIEDVEFFGYVEDTKQPYREEVVVSEITYSLDDPSQNSITIQNYKTQFEDLFQRVAADTQQYASSRGEYELAGEIATERDMSEYLVNSVLERNNAVISNAGAQTVSLDENGLTIKDSVNPNNIVRAVGGGILLSKDGGNTWEMGVTGDGINANLITTGRLRTSYVTIYNDEYPCFQWNGNGLTAYRHSWDEATGRIVDFDPEQFVRMDDNGIYGVAGEDTLVNHPTVDQIQQNAVFSLTWKGMTFNDINSDGWVKISSDPDYMGFDNITIREFIVYTNATLVVSDGPFYERNDQGLYYRSPRQSGPAEAGHTYYVYHTSSTTEQKTRVIAAGMTDNPKPNFAVYTDGTIVATSGYFSGILQCADLLDNNGDSMLEQGRIKAEYLSWLPAQAVFG